MPPSKARCIGILTSGGDCPGLNAAIRGVAKAADGFYGMEVLGILDGFTGLIENRVIHLGDRELSGLLTLGGTILGTSRNKPHRMPMADGSKRDMTGAAVANYRRLHLDCLVCLGGDGTAKNALVLKEAGLNVLMIPKTIDNDVVETDVTFGYDSAMTIATEAIDRLHTTASSHQRIMLVDLMGHNAGWLALGASLAGGADVCLIPEIPFRLDSLIEALEHRRQSGRRFSLISVAEGARPTGDACNGEILEGFAGGRGKPKAKDKGEKIKGKDKGKEKGKPGEKGRGKDADKDQDDGREKPAERDDDGRGISSAMLAPLLEKALGLEARVTTLGHVQRGGIPTPNDRLLATQLGTAAADLVAQGHYNVMVAVRGNQIVPVPLELVAGRKKTIPLDHPLIRTARLVGMCLGD